MHETPSPEVVVDAVCCDIGDVLFYDFPIKLTYAFHMHASISRHHADPPGPWELWHCAGQQVARLTRIDSALWAASNAQAWAHVVDRWDALFQPIPGAHEALAALSYMPIALVANQPKHILPVLEATGIAAIVEHIVLDTLCGSAKPDPGIYLEALERLEHPPHRCVMIGDNIDNDVIPAKLIAMKSIWIEPYPYNDRVSVPDVPDRWTALFRDGRTPRIEEQRQRLAALPPEFLPDVSSPSISAACEHLT